MRCLWNSLCETKAANILSDQYIEFLPRILLFFTLSLLSSFYPPPVPLFLFFTRKEIGFFKGDGGGGENPPPLPSPNRPGLSPAACEWSVTKDPLDVSGYFGSGCGVCPTVITLPTTVCWGRPPQMELLCGESTWAPRFKRETFTGCLGDINLVVRYWSCCGFWRFRKS